MRRLGGPGALFALLGPGILIAATGVGAGDLATAGFAGNSLGTAVLWAVVLGAAVKFVLNEGLARWQLASGTTLLEGAMTRLGRVAAVVFIAYFLPWSFVVGAALISACGVTSLALVHALGSELDLGFGIALGVLHSGIAVLLVLSGGFRLIERLMAVCIAVMFAAVVSTALLLRPDVGAVATGLLWPTIPDLSGEGLTWTVGLMGGVGGTLTMLCYGYWIRESGRDSPEYIRTCRIDLAVGYAMTALFGIAMIVIAAGIPEKLDGRGVGLILSMAEQLESIAGPAGRAVFLIGAWAAVFSSMLGVWQAVPYLFADFWKIHFGGGGPWPYRVYLLCLATIPFVRLGLPFRQLQKYYVIVGAMFIPMLAITLLLMNGRREWVGRWTNRPGTVLALIAVLALSVLAGALQVRSKLG